MFLSNCDPVRRLSVPEIEKRFLLAVTFAEGAIVTPSALLDNTGFATVFGRQNLHKWYNEEGSGTLIVRGPGKSSTVSMADYFDSLPPNHFLTRFGQRKENLSRLQIAEIRDDISTLDRSLMRLAPKAEGAALARNALTDAILQSDEFSAWC